MGKRDELVADARAAIEAEAKAFGLSAEWPKSNTRATFRKDGVPVGHIAINPRKKSYHYEATRYQDGNIDVPVYQSFKDVKTAMLFVVNQRIRLCIKVSVELPADVSVSEKTVFPILEALADAAYGSRIDGLKPINVTASEDGYSAGRSG
jgi:hypothetical protein